MSENVPTPEEGELAEAIGRELDPRAFDRSRFYNDMDYGFYKSRHMYQIDKAVSSDAFRAWLADHDREVAAQALEQFANELRERYPEDVFRPLSDADHKSVNDAMAGREPRTHVTRDAVSADMMRRAAAQADEYASDLRVADQNGGE